MKSLTFSLVVAVIVLSSCGHLKHEHDHDAMAGDSANSALKQMLDTKHMEAMDKMDPIFKLKKKLMDTIANTKGLAEGKKAALENLIHSLDSANDGMMDWMHKFNPNKDSADQEKNRAYLESEIEKINKIDEQMKEAIDRSKDALKK